LTAISISTIKYTKFKEVLVIEHNEILAILCRRPERRKTLPGGLPGERGRDAKR